MSKTANLTFSKSAKAHIEKLIAESKKEDIFLRISVTSGGCAGFQYHFDFDKNKNTDDLEIKAGKKILGRIDESAHELVQNSEIDYVDELAGSFFKLNKLNASSTCGCGSSFSI